LNYEQIVVLEKVSMKFKNIEALNELSFSIGQGEVFGFIGPNGSGKTTTIRLMLDLYPRQAGTILIFGEDPSKNFPNVGSKIGVVFDSQCLYENLSAEEHLVFWGKMLGQRGSNLEVKCKNILQLVGLEQDKTRLIKTYSKGMRQKLAIARAIMNEPQLLILDEPFDGIDIETRHELLTLIPNLVSQLQTSIFITSHNLYDIERLCNRIAIIKKGNLVACDTLVNLWRLTNRCQKVVISLGGQTDVNVLQKIIPEGIFDDQRNELLLKLEEPMESINDYVKKLIDSNIPIISIARENYNLEDIYLDLTRGEEAC
jgi:ABC-2 type transport system ATP-binding protein